MLPIYSNVNSSSLPTFFPLPPTLILKQPQRQQGYLCSGTGLDTKTTVGIIIGVASGLLLLLGASLLIFKRLYRTRRHARLRCPPAAAGPSVPGEGPLVQAPQHALNVVIPDTRSSDLPSPAVGKLPPLLDGAVKVTPRRGSTPGLLGHDTGVRSPYRGVVDGMPGSLVSMASSQLSGASFGEVSGPFTLGLRALCL